MIDLSCLIPPSAPEVLRTWHMAGYLGVSQATVRRWASSGFLPAPAKLGPRYLHWLASEVREALAHFGRPKVGTRCPEEAAHHE
jgi:predicted DNA-binding transcriptional regulator AlpA